MKTSAQAIKNPIAEGGVVPRMVRERERAPEGLCRLKIVIAQKPPRYVLARPDQAGEIEARKLYVQEMGLDDRFADAVSVTKLPD